MDGSLMKIIDTRQLGSAIRTRRKQLKVTQKELAMTCGTGLRFIVDLEKGKPSCQVGKVLRVLQSLGLAIAAGSIHDDKTGGKRHEAIDCPSEQ
jgi:y4mF family transcriptional regulator